MLADPAKYRDQSVTVRGTVDQSASLMGRGAYRITDGDQSLWVVTASGAPRKGARVDVTGRLQDGYDLSAFGNAIKLPARCKAVWCSSSRHTRRRLRPAEAAKLRRRTTFRHTRSKVHS